MENRDNELKFKSLEDLYTRIYPALKSKVLELKRGGYKYIQEVDVWDYLKTYKWVTSRDLDLGCMVNDIFNVDIMALNEFVIDKYKKEHEEM